MENKCLLLSLVLVVTLIPVTGGAQDAENAPVQRPREVPGSPEEALPGASAVVEEDVGGDDAPMDLEALSPGELNILQDLAGQMPGGATPENVQQLLQLRDEGQQGWGQVARELGLNMSSRRNDDASSPANGAAAAAPGVPGEQSPLRNTSPKAARSAERPSLSNSAAQPGAPVVAQPR